MTDASIAAAGIAGSRARAEPAVSAVRLAGLAIQLALAVGVIWFLQVEGAGFRRLSLLILAGFIVHAVLPVAWRLAAFVTLSLVAIPLVLGVADGAWLVGAASVLAGICLAPVPIRWRVGLLAAAGALLALMRAGVLLDPLPPIVWPILGAMFAFRVLVFLYDASHATQPVAPLKVLAYFFLLPNVCFPLFPVVDFKTFDRSYYDDDAFAIYQRGLSWIARGLLHLVLYRVVYHEITLDVTQVQTGGDLVRYVFTVFLLYLRVSGQFHLIIGVLLLFGFNLPETNHRYYLSTSFTDLWRRVNIYWKDMMMKLVYYPSFFVFRRRWSQGRSLTLSIATVMAVTWALHSYQWFWLRGDLLLSASDALFWATLGVLVVWSSGRERQKGQAGRAPAGARGWQLRRGLGTLGVYSTISFLWSMWSAESIGAWLGAMGTLRQVEVTDVLPWLALAVAFVGITGWNWETAPFRVAFLDRLGPGLRTGALLTLLLLVGHPAVALRAGGVLTPYVVAVSKSGLNRADLNRQGRGYYERLNETGAGIGGATARRRDPTWTEINHTAAYRTRDDFLLGELVPNTSITYKRRQFTVNSRGLRDREYSLEKPAGTWRIAMVGPSDVMGYGVADDESFEAVLERRLARDGLSRRYEVLNFGVEGFSLLQSVLMAEQRALAYAPDVIMITVHDLDARLLDRHLRLAVEQGITIPWPEVAEIVARAGLQPGQSSDDMQRRLLGREQALSRIALGRLGRLARERGILVVAVGTRLPLEQPGEDVAGFMRVAEEEGLVVLDLLHVYDGLDESALTVTRLDHHPTAEGHRILAERLLAELKARPALLGLGPDSPAASAPR